MELKERLIKLANDKPELRAKIIPLLKEGGTKWADAKNSLWSVKRSLKYIEHSLKLKDSEQMASESWMLLKFLSSTLGFAGEEKAAKIISDAANKLK